MSDDGAGSGGPVVATLRVGLTRGASSPWRFIVQGEPVGFGEAKEVVEEPATSTVVDGNAGARKARPAVKVAKVAKLPKARAAGAGLQTPD